MKKSLKSTRLVPVNFRCQAALAALATMISVPTLHAVSGNWTATTTPLSWGTAANWSSNPTVPGSAAGDVININSNIAAASVINLDGVRTVGTLLVGDLDSTAAATLTLATGTGGNLTLDQTGVATALVQFGVTGSTAAIANVISAPITLADNARFYTTLTTPQQITGTIGGAFSVTFDNDNGTPVGPTALQGQFLVSNTTASTYSGGTTIDDVRVTIQGSSAALGTGAVNILDGGQMFNSTGLTAIANAFTIAGNGWAETAAGQPFGALRLDSGAIVTGTVALSANAAIGSNSGTGTVNGVISGGFTLSKRGAATIVLGGVNTYSAGTIVDGASGSILQLNNASAAGGGAITWAAGSLGRLRVNGGVAITNAINIPAGLTGISTTGLIERAGTGQATYNGAINISGTTTNGGHIFGSNTVGDEIVIGGVITSSVTVTQRDGRVIYRGGGTGYTGLSVTGTALAGANNGLSTTAIVQLGASGTAALDLNGFDQSLAGLTFGTATTSNAGTVSLGAKTLTLTGDVSVLSNASQNAAHSITATAGGTLAVGASARTFTVADNLAPDDLAINAAAISGPGGIVKAGAGTLALNGVNLAGPLAVNAGTLQTGRANQVGSIVSGSLAFGAGATTLKMKIGASGDLITTGPLTTGGTTTVSLNQLGGIQPNGLYPLINYTGVSPGLGGFSLAPVGHATAVLVDSGTSIGLQISGNDRVIWDGTNTTAWATGATANWKLQSSPVTPADFIESDDTIFPDTPTNSAVAIAANVSPSNVTFNNTVTTSYTVSGAAGIIGATGLTKTANGTVTLTNPNLYSGATTVQAGTLIADYSTATPLAAVSAISIAAPATLKLQHAGGVFSLANPISGAGTVIVDPGTTTAGNRDLTTVTWNTAGFTGLLNLKPTTGTMRITVDTPSDLGGGTVQVDSGGQIFVNTGGLVFPQNMTIAGTGFSETAGVLGAIRSNTDTFTGVITVNGSAKIGALGNTATFTNTFTGGALTFGGSINNAGSETLLLTGNGSGLAGLTVNDASGTSSAATILFSVGSNGTTGTIGAVPVTLKGDGFKTAVIRFDRTDGYTLGAGVTSASPTAANDVRTQLQVDTLGTGFNSNGQTINLGAVATGGAFRVGNVRAGAIANVNGTLTGGSILVSAAAANATLNLGTGANVSVNSVTLGAGGSGGAMTLSGTPILAITSNLHLGEAANNSSTVTQTGGDVTFGTQMRVGHFPTETSTYTISNGTLTATAAAPGTFPYTTGATEQNGGIYLGVDGAGNLTQSGSSIVSTNFIVLDNRGNSGGGANMATGIDTYTLNAGTLILKSAFGLISRNATTSFMLNGGTIQAAAGVSPNLDSDKITVNNTVTLDTNGAGNNFNLYGSLFGSGTLSVTGGGMLKLLDGTGATLTQVGGGMPGGSMGTNSPSLAIAAGSTVQENRTGTNMWAGNVSGAGALQKNGAGYLAIRGSGSGFTGTVSVAAGRLDLTSSFVPASITLADGTSLAGEPTTTNLTLGTATGSTIYIDPNTAGGLTTTNLTLNGVTTIDFASAPTSGTSWRAILYSSKSGAGTVAVANAAAYRVAPLIDDDGSRIAVTITGTRAQTWKGTAGAIWDNGLTANTNWDDGGGANNFFAGDTVVFDGNTPLAVTVTSGVSPWKTTVNSNSPNHYTFNSSGSGIAGPGNLEKSGTSTLTLNGANTYSGQTIINGGTILVSGTSSAPLGNGAVTNTIVFNGGRLDTGNTLDTGATRNISVNAGGGTFGAAGTVNLTIPGNISGTGNLTFTSGATAAPTYILSGNNSGFSGNVNVDSTSVTAGGTTLRLSSNNNALTAGTVTLAQSTVAGAATTLDLVNVTIGSGVTLQMNSNAAGNFRSTLSNSSGYGQWNGPIVMFGTGLNQINSTGSLILNGPVTDGGGFTGTMFIRGGGSGTINGTINLPTGFVSKTDAAVWTINSTGNVWLTTGVLSTGSIRLGIANALPIGALLSIGQATDANASLLEMNGFNQQVNGLTWIPGTANSARAVGNSSATQAILDLSSSTDYTFGASTGITGGNITGNITLIKNGTNTQTLAGPANTYTGNVTVNTGTLVAGGGQTSTALGNPTIVGRTVTVNSTGTLSFTTNNVFGSGVGNNNLPAVTVSGVLTSTRYNVLGNLTLLGGTLTQAATDAGNFEGYQFRGTVGVAGTAASTISTTNGKANHLGANTVFNVANATGDANTDLTVSTILRNQSGDFGLAAGALTKSGNGTMALTAANTFTGGVTINDGILNVNADAALGAAAGAVAISNNARLQAGGAVSTTARTVTLGVGGGTIDTNGNDVTLGAGSTVTGTTLTKVGAGKLVLSGTQTYATLDTEAGRTDIASAVGTGTSAIIANAETNISVDQTLASLTIGNGAVVTLGAPLPPAPGGAGEIAGLVFDLSGGAASVGGDLAGAPIQGVPEPGSAALIFGGMLTLLGLRRRR